MANLLKLVVFVPKTHTDVVVDAIGNAGAGLIGNYSHCVSITDSIGKYKPLDGAHPFIGKVGEFVEVKEDRVETVCRSDKIKAVIKAIKKVHPYEEIAFDIYPLLTEEEV